MHHCFRLNEWLGFTDSLLIRYPQVDSIRHGNDQRYGKPSWNFKVIPLTFGLEYCRERPSQGSSYV